MDIRVGHGFDVHRFGPGEYVTIGGVQIPHRQSLLAHSDGDVLIHALCDALLGAAGLGDIGRHFPDNNPAYRNIDSRKLLCDVIGKVGGIGWGVINADMTIVAQAPKMAPHIPDMVKNLARDCGVRVDQINVKATTTENLGYTGREEGIAAHAVVLLSK